MDQGIELAVESLDSGEARTRLEMLKTSTLLRK
jgi:hypothetical protein